jgi:hypothetical protein
MRTYGRIAGADGTLGRWVEVTDIDQVNITTLIQNLKLNLGESPFYSNNGIPAQRSVIQQIFPDYYVTKIQSEFAQYFSTLQITKRPTTTPTYDILATLINGAILTTQVAG